jgi:glucosamine--fructose-6-phosphate aminotransferase (isomerizing)
VNLEDPKYSAFGLVKDMLATPDVVAGFDANRMRGVADQIRGAGKLLLTGEGSSRIFPAKHALATSLRRGYPFRLHTEAGKQSQEYQLADWAVFALSNSGRTAEVIQLFSALKAAGHKNLFSLTAFADSKLESLANQGFVLGCGPEGAVAATKSVVEQALFYQGLIEHLNGDARLGTQLGTLAGNMRTALTTPIAADIVQKVASARTICFAGRNEGVAEELALKTNEITRKPSAFFEGTYGAHGVEEVLTKEDVLVWVEPFADQEEKFATVLEQGVGMSVIAIASRPTRFPTILIPESGDLRGFVQLLAGWSLLVEVGIALGIDLDKPQRARKVGNEFTG